MEPPVVSVSAGTAGVLVDVAQRLGASLDLTLTLEQVAKSVVEQLGFGVAVVNLVVEGGRLDVVAFAGPDDMRDALEGQQASGEDWAELLAASEPRGRLRFLDGRAEEPVNSNLYFFVPDLPVDGREDAWHPLDALFAPLHGRDGALLGVLSVDMPSDGMRPDETDCAMLEVFAVQAALAIDHARMYSELQASVLEQERVQEQLRHRALHDPLTGLANRELLLDRLDQALARARRDSRAIAVLFLDVDHFKLVNDSLGHGVGDDLLVALAATIGRQLREVDTAGRLGGDEFVVVLEDLSGPAEAIVVAERVLVAVREPLRLGGEQVRTSLSIGISVASATSTGPELLAEADTALYRAKASGRGRWEVFDADMRSQALAHLALRTELVTAVALDQFRLHYQPIVDLRSGAALGYEALLRWEHPTRGLLLPGIFLEVLEDSDADSPVAEWVLERACSDAAAWPLADLFVSVNVSPRQLSRPDLARRVAAVLERTGLPPGRLWIEVTEDRPLDAHQDVADVTRLRELGVHVALDDFGTGYAGLTYLQRLPADVLKVDRVFVSQLEHDPVSRGIVGAVVGLARVLGLRIVAEGVETSGQAAALRKLGVPYAQGFLFGRPGPLPGSSVFTDRPGPGLPDDLPGDLPGDLPADLRRLQAALARSSSAEQVVGLAVQAASRAVGAEACCFTVVRDGRGRTLHSVGVPPEDVADEFSLARDHPTCRALTDGRAAWLQRDPGDPAAPSPRHPSWVDRALTVVPVVDRGVVHGALTVSWRRPGELTELLQGHLLSMGSLVGARLAELLPVEPGAPDRSQSIPAQPVPSQPGQLSVSRRRRAR